MNGATPNLIRLHMSSTLGRASALVAPLLAIAIPLAGVDAHAQAPAAARDTIAAVDRVFARYSTRTPGCAVGVARPGGAPIVRAYGMAELEHGSPVRPTTVFEAGSVSKQFTAFLTLLVEQDGKLSLDDPLRKYLPELPDYGRPLTIRQVLSHTSGLRDWYGVAEVQGVPAYEHHVRNADVLEYASRQRSLNFPSGSEYLYSNTGWNLLPIVIERVTGQSFQEFSRRRLFEPLGMTRTQWRDDFRTVVPDRAPAYAPAATGWTHLMPLMSLVGAGGLLTTVDDLLRWNDNLSTGRVGGQELVRRMQTRARLASGREIDYGLGLSIGSARGMRVVDHGGATGGYRAHLIRYPERGLSIALLCNESGAGASALASGVADVFLGAAPAPPAVAALPDPEAAAMRGVYRNTRTGEPVELALRDARPVLGAYSLSVLRRANDSVVALLGVTPVGDSVVFERASRWTPTSAALREFVGQYGTEEALATWRVALSGDTLILLGPAGRRVALRPAYRDAFAAPGIGTALFRRDRRGRVVAVSFLMGRLRDLRLERR